MHSRGYTDAMFVLTCLIAMAIIIVGQVKLTSETDPGFVQRTFVTENVAFIVSAINFLPGNAEYLFFSEDDHMKRWDPFTLPAGSTFTYTDPGREFGGDSTYKTFLNSRFLVQPYIIETTGEFAQINKRYNTPGKQGDLLFAGESDARQLRCTGNAVRFDWTFHSTHGGEIGTYYSDKGQVVSGTPTVDYVGMDEQLFIDGRRVALGNPGEVVSSSDEGEILAKVVSSLTSSYSDEAYIDSSFLDEPHFLLDISDDVNNGIIAYVSHEDYAVQYETACQVINSILYDDEIVGINRVAIIPYVGDHLVLHIGSRNHPDFFNDVQLERISKHLRTYSSEVTDVTV